MNPGARPHEREAIDDLEAELGALGAVVRSTTLPEPPPGCEAAIRAAAHDAARRKRRGGGRWSGVLAAAATVSLAVGIGWHATRDPPVTLAPGSGRSAAAPAARAPDEGAAAARVTDAMAAGPALDSAAATAPAAARATAAGGRPDPVAWLARIETLRSAGRIDEAAREAALLDAAWPGWRESVAPGR